MPPRPIDAREAGTPSVPYQQGHARVDATSAAATSTNVPIFDLVQVQDFLLPQEYRRPTTIVRGTAIRDIAEQREGLAPEDPRARV